METIEQIQQEIKKLIRDNPELAVLQQALDNTLKGIDDPLKRIVIMIVFIQDNLAELQFELNDLKKKLEDL